MFDPRYGNIWTREAAEFTVYNYINLGRINNFNFLHATIHSLDRMYNILAIKLNNSSLFYFIPNNETCLQEIKKLWEEASLLFCFYDIFYEFCKRRAWCLICLRAKKDEKNLEETFFEKGCAHFLCA